MLTQIETESAILAEVYVEPQVAAASVTRQVSIERNRQPSRAARSPWRRRMMTFASNRTEFSKRGARYSDYNRDWQLADESQPFGMMGGMSFPLFAPAFSGGGSLASGYSPATRTARRPYPSLDYDRPSPQDGMARLPSSNYYDPAKESPSSGPPPPSQTSPSRGYSSSGTDGRRYPKPKYGPSYAQSVPGYSTKSRAKSPSGPSYGGPPPGMPPDPFFPEYDDSIPRYSYNPSEIPKCAKDSNISYCVDDPEYPM